MTEPNRASEGRRSWSGIFGITPKKNQAASTYTTPVTEKKTVEMKVDIGASDPSSVPKRLQFEASNERFETEIVRSNERFESDIVRVTAGLNTPTAWNDRQDELSTVEGKCLLAPRHLLNQAGPAQAVDDHSSQSSAGTSSDSIPASMQDCVSELRFWSCCAFYIWWHIFILLVARWRMTPLDVESLSEAQHLTFQAAAVVGAALVPLQVALAVLALRSRDLMSKVKSLASPSSGTDSAEDDIRVVPTSIKLDKPQQAPPPPQQQQQRGLDGEDNFAGPPGPPGPLQATAPKKAVSAGPAPQGRRPLPRLGAR
jgi:hypothetical protein